MSSREIALCQNETAYNKIDMHMQANYQMCFLGANLTNDSYSIH